MPGDACTPGRVCGVRTIDHADGAEVSPIHRRCSQAAERLTPSGQRLAGAVADHRTHQTCPKTVIDVDHRHASRTTVEHGQQGRKSAEACPVADTGRYGDDRRGDKTGNNARESTLHARYNHNRAGGIETLRYIQQAVQSGDPDVEYLLDGACACARDPARLSGNRDVRCACGHNEQGWSVWTWWGDGADRCYSGGSIVLDDLKLGTQQAVRLVVDKGGQRQPVRIIESLCDIDHLLWRLTTRIDHLRKAAAQSPVVIHAGKADVLEWETSEAVHCLGRIDFAGRHLLEEPPDGFCIFHDPTHLVDDPEMGHKPGDLIRGRPAWKASPKGCAYACWDGAGRWGVASVGCLSRRIKTVTF